MTDLEFQDRAEELLRAVEVACDHMNDDTDVDIDNQRVGGMITLEFRNRTQIVINLQKPLHEVWLAAKSGGYHFKFVSGQWRDTKNAASEFFERLNFEGSKAASVDLRFNT